MHFVHRCLHAALGAIEFLAHTLPFALVGRLGNRLRVRRDRIANADSLRQTQDALADLLHRRCVFGLDRDKAIGNDGAEKQSDPRSFGKIAALFGAHIFAPID